MLKIYILSSLHLMNDCRIKTHTHTLPCDNSNNLTWCICNWSGPKMKRCWHMPKSNCKTFFKKKKKKFHSPFEKKLIYIITHINCSLTGCFRVVNGIWRKIPLHKVFNGIKLLMVGIHTVTNRLFMTDLWRSFEWKKKLFLNSIRKC